jgi:hypothetical protein
MARASDSRIGARPDYFLQLKPPSASRSGKRESAGRPFALMSESARQRVTAEDGPPRCSVVTRLE